MTVDLPRERGRSRMSSDTTPGVSSSTGQVQSDFRPLCLYGDLDEEKEWEVSRNFERGICGECMFLPQTH